MSCNFLFIPIFNWHSFEYQTTAIQALETNLHLNAAYCGFDYLPSEIIAIVLRYLSPLDRIRACPLTCKNWHKISLTDKKQPRDLLYAELGYPVDRLLLNNNFFDELSQQVKFSEREGTHSHKYAHFTIVLDTSTGKAEVGMKGKWGDLRHSYLIGLSQTLENVGRQSLSSFDLSVHKIGLPEKALPFCWYKLKLKKAETKFNHAIEKALQFELQHHIQYFGEINVATISSFLKTVRNQPIQLIFSCNRKGLIENAASEDYRGPSFILETKKVNGAPYLSWKAHDLDYHAMEKLAALSFNLEQAVRWCVLAKTAKGIAELFLELTD